MADFLLMADYFLNRGYERITCAYWEGFKKKVNGFDLYFWETKKTSAKIIKFEAEKFNHKKKITGLKQRPKTHIMQLIQQAEAACISKAHIEAFKPRLTGILPMVEE